MTGGALLDRVAEAGAAASLDPDGRVRIAGASRLPAELLELLRRNRAAVAEALAASRGATVDRAGDETPAAPDPDDAAERAAMAEHHAAPPEARPWRPGDPDPLGAGLLAGWHASRRVRLATLAQRLREARPKREHGVRQLDWAQWEDAAREAAGLPSAAWAAWRAKLGTGGARP